MIYRHFRDDMIEPSFGEIRNAGEEMYSFGGNGSSVEAVFPGIDHNDTTCRYLSDRIKELLPVLLGNDFSAENGNSRIGCRHICRITTDNHT